MLGVDKQLVPEVEGVVNGFSGLAFGQVRGLFGLKLEADALEDGNALFLADGTAVEHGGRGIAARTCKSLKRKRVTPHVLRYTAAMMLLHAGVDRSVIALWLGHESAETTDIYLHADMTLKERALARTTPLQLRNKRFRPSDRLLAFLEAL